MLATALRRLRPRPLAEGPRRLSCACPERPWSRRQSRRPGAFSDPARAPGHARVDLLLRFVVLAAGDDLRGAVAPDEARQAHRTPQHVARDGFERLAASGSNARLAPHREPGVLPREESLDALLDRMGVRVGIQHPAKRLNRCHHADLGPGPLAGSRGHQLAQRLVGGSRQTPQQLASSGGTLPSGGCGLELLMDGNKAKETLGGLGCELIGRQVRVICGQSGGVGHGTPRALPDKALCPSSRTPCAAAH